MLREESQQLSRYIQKKSSANTAKRYYGTGSYVRPVGGYISSRFGLRRHPIFKRRRMHTGMDFVAPRGYRIKAADSGKVYSLDLNVGMETLLLLITVGVKTNAYHHYMLTNGRYWYKRGAVC